jgi:hypothetical protein
MLLRCPEQYRRRYVENEIIPPGLALLRGRATHEAVAYNYKQRRDEGSYLIRDDLEDAAATYFEAELQQEYQMGSDYEELDPKQARGQAKDESVKMTLLHGDEVAPLVSPHLIETKVETPPSTSAQVPLIGRLDLIDGDQIIRDVKTVRKSPGADDAHRSTQLTFYELLYRAHHKKQPSKGLALDYLVCSPTGKLSYVERQTERSTSDLNALIYRIEAANRLLEAEIFPPTLETSWWCHEKWCGYALTCPYYRGRSRPHG